MFDLNDSLLLTNIEKGAVMNVPVRVLVVEDTPLAQAVIKSNFKLLGCTVDVANDGNEALEKALTIPYDLILMDIELGDGLDGFDVTALIKDKSPVNKLTPIMAVTAHSEPAFQEKANQVGMVGYFNKPFKPEDTIKAIEYLDKD